MTNLLGYAAASAVFATFLMRSMVPLRLVAMLSNILFLAYGSIAHIHPILVLHAALLPINAARLVTHTECRAGSNLRSVAASAGARFSRLSLFILGVIAGSLAFATCAVIAFVIVEQRRKTLF